MWPVSYRNSWLYYATVQVEYRKVFTRMLFLDCTELQLNKKKRTYTQSADLYIINYAVLYLLACVKGSGRRRLHEGYLVIRYPITQHIIHPLELGRGTQRPFSLECFQTLF